MEADSYIVGLEKQNEELQNRLATYEVLVKKLSRKGGTYPIFKLIKIKRGRIWHINESFLTNCSSVDHVKMCINYNIKRPILTDRDGADGMLIGFKYWRQPINYKWSVCAMSHYFDMQMKCFDMIRIDPKSGLVYTINY